MSTIHRVYTKDFSEIKEEIQNLNRLKWYQRWWGVLILGIIASAFVVIVYHFVIILFGQ